MARLVRPLLIAAALLAVVSSAEAAGEIRWYNNLKQASEAAQKANLPMFIDFWADWCGACKVMDDDVYTDPKVIRAFEERVVGVRLHFDLQPELARKYNVPALPFLVFTNSYGTPLVYHRGFLEADDLSKALDAMPALDAINRIDRTLQSDKNDFPSLLAMARTLRASAFFESSNNFYQRVSKHPALKADAATRETVFNDMALNWLELQDGKQAAALLEKTLKEFPKSERKPELMLALGRAYALDEKKDKARKSLTSVISEYPGSKSASEAQSLLGSL